MSGPETEEHKLRRLLYTGGTSSVVQLRGGLPKAGSNNSINSAAIGGIKKGVLQSVTTLIQPNVGNTNLALQHCLAAREHGLADKRALFLVLSACLRIDCKQTKTETYTAIKSLIHSFDDFFEFIYYHEKIFTQKPRGMGAGMRRLVSDWYLGMDAYELVLETFRVRGRHYWGHKDLINLARVRSTDPGKAVVLSYLMQGNQKTQLRYKEDTGEAQPVLEYLACMRELNKCRDPQHALTLIARHTFDLELVGTELLKDETIWEHCVPRTSLRGVLSRLRQMTCKGFLSTEESPVRKKVESVLRDRHALRASNLQPAEILGVLAQLEVGFALSPGTHKPAHERRVPKCRPHPSLEKELARMLEASSMNVAKLPCKVHICVDIQSNKYQCWGAWNLHCLRAVSLTIFTLLHADTDLTVSFYQEKGKGRLEFIDVSPRDSMATILEKLTEKAVTASKVPPEEVLKWSRESGARCGATADLVMVITDSNLLASREDIWAELEQARVNDIKVKFIYWALASKFLDVNPTNENYPNILGIAGWSPDSIRIIQAFAKDFF